MLSSKPSIDDILNGKVSDSGDVTDSEQAQTAEEILADMGGIEVNELPKQPQQLVEESFPDFSLESSLIEQEMQEKNDDEIKDHTFENSTTESQEDLDSVFPENDNSEELSTIQLGIESIQQDAKTLAEGVKKTTEEIREIHKLYHNEFATRLKSMQDELDHYHEIDRGRVFDGILGEVAKLYSDYESVIEDIAEEKVQKRIRYLFEDIEQILEAHGVVKQKSKTGEKRNTRYCQVIERIPTDTNELHDTVVQSRGTGFYIENRPLIKERVDIYLSTENNDKKVF